MNPWVQFLKDNRGKGLQVSELRDQYMSRKDDAPVVYNYDANADDKIGSLLETIKSDYDIAAINKKITDYDDLTPQEEEQWLLAFELVLTDEYTLTKQKLLTSHDAWLRSITDIDDNDNDIENKLSQQEHKDIHDFIDDVLQIFTIRQLHSIKFNELQ
jgi:hypothetical protein